MWIESNTWGFWSNTWGSRWAGMSRPNPKPVHLRWPGTEEQTCPTLLRAAAAETADGGSCEYSKKSGGTYFGLVKALPTGRGTKSTALGTTAQHFSFTKPECFRYLFPFPQPTMSCFEYLFERGRADRSFSCEWRWTNSRRWGDHLMLSTFGRKKTLHWSGKESKRDNRNYTGIDPR